jgi:glycosyltransferase involved in cell wall biosynthesis
MTYLPARNKAENIDRVTLHPNRYKPFVSVVIPSYNQARFLERAIESVLSQTYPYYEVIVVDDGSTDNSWEVVATFDYKIRYIWQENKGLGGARNTGIIASHGDIIGLLDADDEWMPNYLERMVEFIQANPSAAVYYCSARAINQDNNKLPQIFGGPAVSTELLYNKLLGANFLIPSTILLRKDVVIREGLFEENNRIIHGCEDWDLWLRLASNYLIIGSSDCLVRYRIHDNSLSTDPSRMQNAAHAVIKKHFGNDDGNPETWIDDKRRAYGGVYCYHLLTSIQRQKDWKIAVKYLQQALFVNPSISKDLDLFYELALGSQPIGFRGTSFQLKVEENANNLYELLSNVFNSKKTLISDDIRRSTIGTAYFALGLVAYNTSNRSLSRKYLRNAILYRPDLWRDSRITGNYLKSFLSESMIRMFKSIKKLYNPF